MIERSSVLMLKMDPAATLKVTVVISSLRLKLPISLPSRKTVTFPSLKQLPNFSVAFPSDQKEVEIDEVDHFWVIHLNLSMVFKRFQQASSVVTKRFFELMFCRSHPFSLMLLDELKSVIPGWAHATVGPKKYINRKIQ